MNGARLGTAQSVGITEAAYREAVAYTQEENNLEVPLRFTKYLKWLAR